MRDYRTSIQNASAAPSAPPSRCGSPLPNPPPRRGREVKECPLPSRERDAEGREREHGSPPDAINDFVSEQFHLEGERRNVIAACATGAYSIALAASWIEQGICDVVLAGSVEPYPHALMEAGFRQMGVISLDGITRPFDRKRSGFTFGEGAGVVVLESESHAARRQARGLAHLSGWALGSDSHSAVAFNSNGAKIAGVVDRALARGGLSARDIRHVNAHGTGTRLNDWIETQALIKAFGSHAKDLMISATKARTGHLLGASGSVEFILTALALTHQFIPPTATLETPDPECPLDYTPRQGHGASFDHALSLSFGFGGPIGALVVGRC
jgi:3-oxoacyl-[acyl-carrier-protein] synthase II